MLSAKNLLFHFVGLALFLFTTPVLAVRKDACGNYACGSATWSWNTRNSIRDISVSVKDNECDGKYAYIYLKVEHNLPAPVIFGSTNALLFENHSGCDGGYKVKNTASYSNANGIREISVYVCRSDAAFDTCYHSSTVTNPNFPRRYLVGNLLSDGMVDFLWRVLSYLEVFGFERRLNGHDFDMSISCLPAKFGL